MSEVDLLTLKTFSQSIAVLLVLFKLFFLFFAIFACRLPIIILIFSKFSNLASARFVTRMRWSRIVFSDEVFQHLIFTE